MYSTLFCNSMEKYQLLENEQLSPEQAPTFEPNQNQELVQNQELDQNQEVELMRICPTNKKFQ